MGQSQEFRTAAVISAVYGKLLCDIGEVYEVLTFLIGRSVFTHELSQAGRLAAPSVFAEHPALVGLDTDGINPENWREELARLEERLGPTLLLHPMGWNALADKDPVETAVEIFGEDRVIVLDPEEGRS